MKETMPDKLPETMSGVLLSGHGGFDKLEYRTDIPVPQPGDNDVLIRVRGTSVNNTDINTRTAWYARSVRSDTQTTTSDTAEPPDVGSWTGNPLTFPLIQGADCFGTVVAAGRNVSDNKVGRSVLVRSMMYGPVDFRPYECATLGSEFNGAFAQYCAVHEGDAFEINCDLSDIELGAIPCAFSTAEGMLVRAGITEKDRILVTGASGGVGLAAVQLARLRGTEVIAVASRSKLDEVLAAGASKAVAREADLIAELGENSVTAVVDLVGGETWPCLLDLLRPGGRYVTAGAIAGPIVELDLRTLYLKDLSLYGCVYQESNVFPNLVRYLEEGRLRPRIAATYPLEDIIEAQKKFLEKDFVGKIGLIPPQD